MAQALEAFKAEGLRAQPNRVYYTASDETSEDGSAAVSAAAYEDATENDPAAEVDQTMQVSASVQVDDPSASQQWALESLDMYRAWGISKCKEDGATNSKVSVAVIDTGCLVIIKATTDDAGNNSTTETLAQAYTWLLSSTGTRTNAQAYNVRVENMSVGGKGSIEEDDLLYQKITEAKNANILTVCAAGNASGTAVPSLRLHSRRL